MAKAKRTKATKRARQPVERFPWNAFLVVVPLPGCDDPLGERGVVTPEWAAKWLRWEHAAWATWSRRGYNAKDARTRDLFSVLAGDVDMLTDAALYVEQTGRSLRVERNDGDALDEALGRIVASHHLTAGGEGPYIGAYEALAEFLSARIAAREKRRRLERARIAAEAA